MWPPATGILARVTREETTIGPYTLPANMLIGTNIIGLMHNPKYYDNPSVFNPDRWATQGAHTTESYSFIPFSGGTKSCIGKYLALMETKLIMIYLLNEFDFERTEVPLRLQARFLYEPIEEDLVRLKRGGMRLQHA
jgi:cytochrome P450